MAEKIIDVPGFGPTAFPDTMSDDDIVQAIQKQHPDLTPKAAPVAPAAPLTAADKLRGMMTNAKVFVDSDPSLSGPINGAIGFAKDTGSTALSLFNLARRAYGNPQTPDIPKPDFLKPEGLPQQVGAGISTAAQFALPSAAASEIPAVAKLGLLGRSGVEGLISSGVSGARGADASTALETGLVTGGMTAGAGLVAKALKPLGERIELALLKPLKADLADVKGPPELAPQTMIKNLYKYDLGGTLPQSYEKAQALTKDLGNQLRAALGSNPKAEVDLMNVLSDTAQELKVNQAGNFGTNANVGKAVDKMLDEIQMISQSGKVNLADAQDVKQALGFIGSWQNGLRDADSTATETVANAMYSKLKTAIEQASGQSQTVQDINRQFSEIIPIKNALIRRIPVAARQDVIGLKQAIGLVAGGPSGLALSAADKLLKSGSVANALVQAGGNPIGTAAKVAPLVGTAADRLRSRMNPNP